MGSKAPPACLSYEAGSGLVRQRRDPACKTSEDWWIGFGGRAQTWYANSSYSSMR